MRNLYNVSNRRRRTTGRTECSWCGELIKKNRLRLRFAPPKGYNYYLHQECGIKYLEGLYILLKNGEKGRIGRAKAEKALKNKTS